MIWWSAAVCLGVLLFWWAGRRDWRAGAILAGVAAGYLPWFLYPERTMFFFYAVSFEPFLVLALVYCLGLVLGQRTDPPVAAAFRACTSWRSSWPRPCCVSAFFYPVWTAETIPYQDWRFRMWMPSWI